MAKRLQYRMKYTEDWETDENLKDWIQPVDGDDRKAKCKRCEVILPAHHVGLCGHALDKKHLKKMSEYYTTSLALESFVNNNLETGSNDSSCQSETDELLEDCHTVTSVESQEPDDTIENHQKSKEHTKKTAKRDHDAKAGIKYQKRWHKNPRFAGWLAPVDGYSTKAKCLYCEVELRAHSTDLGRHTRTKKHKFRSELWFEKNADANATMAAVGMFETKIAGGGVSSALSRESNRDGRNRKRKSKIKNQAKAPPPQVQPSSQSASTDNDTDLLFLECEAVDERKESLLLKRSLKKKSSAKKLIISVAHNPISLSRDEGVTASEETSIPNHPLSLPSDSNADQLTAASGETDDAFDAMDAVVVSKLAAMADTDAKAGSTSMTDSAAEAAVDGYDLQKQEGDSMELKHIVSSTSDGVECLPSEAERSKSLPESIQPAARKRKLVKIPKTKKKIRIQRAQMNEFDDEDLLFMDSDFEEPSNSRQKSASHSNVDWSRYKKMYRKEWEMDPVLGDWVAPVDGDRLKAACKLCGCILRAHYTDLRHHRKTKKHTRNAHPLHNEASKLTRQLTRHQNSQRFFKAAR